ncbi:MAG TPA: amidohydrolase family protein [Pseudolabrys sp.]|nr:amidohydrolase family protein [Pseudolabrys sp.]
MSTIWNKYADTAARAHGKPGRTMRPKGVTIDIHAHAAVPAAAKFVGSNLDPASIPLAHFSSDHTKAVSAKQEGDIKPRMTEYDDRFRDMDAMGVDMQFVMPGPPQCYHTVRTEIAVPAARIVNDGIAEYCARHKDRLIPCGTVPMQDGHEAAKELDYCKSLGFRGVEILTNVNGKELSDPAFAPFWKRAEELGMLVVLHPNGFTEGTRMARHYFSNVIGNPLETTLALHYLIFDGVLERHPNLKILAVHGGGFLGAYPGRIDHAWGARSDSNGGLPNPPTSYLKKIYVDTVVFTPLQLETLVKTFGSGQVLMGTDFPFDMLEHDPIGHIASVDSFDETTRAALAGGNAKALLGL